MKSFSFALFMGLALIAVPASAQFEGPDSLQFIKAVQERDGNKATQLLTDHPTVINAKDGKGDTGLVVALRNGDSDWAEFLLSKGADPSLPGAGGDTPLITAAKSGLYDMADVLLRLGVRVDGTNKSGETPLIIAVQQRDLPMVKLLLEHGADPDRTDHVAGYSARDYANRDSRNREILRLINEKKPKAASTASN